MRSRGKQFFAFMLVAAAVAGCARNQRTVTPHEVTVYYCRAGTGVLVSVPYTVDAKLQGAALDNFLVSQVIAGPSGGREALALFPADTTATVTKSGQTDVVDLRGSLDKRYPGGTTDEIGMFKSLVYTLTAQPNVKDVQVKVDGQTLAALPGGHLELDEPLTRETFAQ